MEHESLLERRDLQEEQIASMKQELKVMLKEKEAAERESEKKDLKLQNQR